MRVRLLIVTQYYWPEDFRINDLTCELVRRGHEITVLTGLPNYPNGEVFPEFRAEPGRFSGHGGTSIVRVPILPRGHGGGARLFANYASFVLSACVIGAWKLRGRAFDGIFVYEPSPITVGIPAALLRALKKAPVVLWVLDIWPETLSAVGVVRNRTILAMIGRLVAAIYARCDLILAQSRSFVPQIRRLCPPQARVEYFPSWAESIFETDPGPEPDELPPKEGCFEIMFAGNVGDAQDFPAILDAAQSLLDRPHVRWLIVGHGRAADWVAAEIGRRGLSGSVIMLGRHPLERMPAFYRRADALLVSLRDEPIFAMTIPGKLQSYLMAGVPILGMLNGEGARAIEAAAAGYTCAAGDGAALGRAVLAMSSLSETERAAMGARGRDYGRSEFGRQGLIDRLEAWLRALQPPIKRHTPPAME